MIDRDRDRLAGGVEDPFGDERPCQRLQSHTRERVGIGVSIAPDHQMTPAATAATRAATKSSSPVNTRFIDG
jgi:hypothetical protein